MGPDDEFYFLDTTLARGQVQVMSKPILPSHRGWLNLLTAG